MNPDFTQPHSHGSSRLHFHSLTHNTHAAYVRHKPHYLRTHAPTYAPGTTTITTAKHSPLNSLDLPPSTHSLTINTLPPFHPLRLLTRSRAYG